MGAIERVDPAEAGLNAERLKRIPAYFDTYIQKRKLPCVAALVARGGQVAHLSFQGSTEMGGGRPIDADTIYRIYSMTKPVTSVAAMMLFEEGALRLDHEVYRYIPEFQDVMVMGEDGQLHKPAVEQAGFAVLKAPDIPSVLVETAFISNPQEEKRLADPDYQQKVARAIHTGIRNYFLRYPPPARPNPT